jgi:hypothetical protein
MMVFTKFVKNISSFFLNIIIVLYTFIASIHSVQSIGLKFCFYENLLIILNIYKKKKCLDSISFPGVCNLTYKCEGLHKQFSFFFFLLRSDTNDSSPQTKLQTQKRYRHIFSSFLDNEF